ncbi:MAG: hypothetical protein H7X92_07010 [Chitinophagales bacterium]|nr:hypothetical protein [Hyphomicrobiales bacterium]
MTQTNTLSAAQFLLNCGCGDSNCSSCYLFFPKANCGDSDCSSCVCIIPTSAYGAIVMIAAEDKLFAMQIEAGRVITAAFIA